MTEISVQTRGKKGHNVKSKPNLGQVIIFIGGVHDLHGSIDVDAFQGQGDTYKRRENAQITIIHKKNVFKGTFKELINKLK